jgi:hypothetical protein
MLKATVGSSLCYYSAETVGAANPGLDTGNLNRLTLSRASSAAVHSWQIRLPFSSGFRSVRKSVWMMKWYWRRVGPYTRPSLSST